MDWKRRELEREMQAQLIADKLTPNEIAALQPCAHNRLDVKKHGLIKWSTRPGHRYPSPKLNSLGYRVRDIVNSKTPS